MTVSLRHVLRAFCDLNGDLSFTKLLIIAITIALYRGLAISPYLATVLLAAAFGKSMFEKFLAKGTFSTAATETVDAKVDVAQILHGGAK